MAEGWGSGAVTSAPHPEAPGGLRVDVAAAALEPAACRKTLNPKPRTPTQTLNPKRRDPGSFFKKGHFLTKKRQAPLFPENGTSYSTHHCGKFICYFPKGGLELRVYGLVFRV